MKLRPLFAVAALAVFSGAASADDLDKAIPAAAADPASTASSEMVVLAGGCFWGQQGLFEHVKGVTKVVAGYSGGAKETATYPQVTTETTGHAESVQITFDPRQISFGTLLRIYFSVAHDPPN
jgi:peptide-methionine (S)-S-oxide reductase